MVYILHVANIFKGFKHHAGKSMQCLGIELAHYGSESFGGIYLSSIFFAFHVTKNTRLSMPAQLQCSRSGAREPGNEARVCVNALILICNPDYNQDYDLKSGV